MAQRQVFNIESVLLSVGVSALTTIFLAIAGTYLYRRYGWRVPGLQPELSHAEQVERGLAGLNVAETQAGRAPFVLTRAVAPTLPR